jgi:hypothetical protein
MCELVTAAGNHHLDLESPVADRAGSENAIHQIKQIKLNEKS